MWSCERVLGVKRFRTSRYWGLSADVDKVRARDETDGARSGYAVVVFCQSRKAAAGLELKVYHHREGVLGKKKSVP
jgi:hypothetical protein